MEKKKIKSYRDLEVWKLSMQVTKDVFQLTNKFDTSQKRVLVEQMQRASVSIPSNIAEGYGRSSRKEYVKFLYYANGSRCELETQLILAVEMGYAEKASSREIMANLISIGKMLTRLIDKLKTTPTPKT